MLFYENKIISKNEYIVVVIKTEFYLHNEVYFLSEKFSKGFISVITPLFP